MLHEVFAVYNVKAKFYHQPFHVKHESDADKNFEMAVNDPRTLQNRYPEDYALHHLGQFDDNTAQYSAFTTPIHKLNAVQVKKQASKEQIHVEFDKIYDLMKEYYGDNQMKPL